jgi:hypothetical protein
MSTKDHKKDKLKPVPAPRSPGFTKRRIRVARAEAQIDAKVRRQAEIDKQDSKKPERSEDDLLKEIEDEVAKKLDGHGPGVLKQYLKIAPTSHAPRRDDILSRAEVLAMRQTDHAQQLEALFSGAGSPRGRGRPSDRALAIAVFQRLIWETGRPDVRSNVRDFLGSDQQLDFVYGEPVTQGTSGVHERSVRDTMKAMLDRHHPEAAVAANVQAIVQLSRTHANVGRWLAIDGTHVQTWNEQAKGYSPQHEALLNRTMKGIGFGTHGDHFWRGKTLIVLTDLVLSLPVAWIVVPANAPEAPSVAALLDLLYKLWPDCPVEYLVADRGFDQEELHRTLEECYGVHPVSPWKRNNEKTDGQPGTLGTPYCNCGTEPRPMKLKQSDNFYGSAKRRADGIAPGTHIDLSEARLRWYCPRERPDGTPCLTSEDRYFLKDPRRHCFLPREGDHLWRIDMRKALLVRRNVAESIFAQIKHRGIAGRGTETARWVSSSEQMDWLLGGALVGLTRRRLVHETGGYDDAHREIVDRGLTKFSGAGG